MNEQQTIGSAMKEYVDLVCKYEAAIRKHRDQRGDDRCWMDDEELYKILPEGYVPPQRDELVEIGNCIKFIGCRHRPSTTYVSPQRRIEELEAENAKLKEQSNNWGPIDL